MEERELQAIAAQLRQPHGEKAEEVGEIMNKGNKVVNENAISALNVQDKDVILEIGMGNGLFVNKILNAANNVHYIGCDFSEDMIIAAEALNDAAVDRGSAEFYLTNAHTLPLENKSVNKIMTVNTVYFWEDPTKILAEFKRVLKPKGMLILGLRPKSDLEKFPVTKYGFKMYSEEELTTLLADNGFSVMRTDIEKEPEREMFGLNLSVHALVMVAEIS